MDHDTQNMPNRSAQGVPTGQRTFHLKAKAKVSIVRPVNLPAPYPVEIGTGPGIAVGPHPVGIGFGPGEDGRVANPILWGAAANAVPNQEPEDVSTPTINPVPTNPIPNTMDHLAGCYTIENGKEVRRSQRLVKK